VTDFVNKIPVWKRELLKKIQSNKVEVETSQEDNKVVISEPHVKVSQNIFVVRETKPPKKIFLPSSSPLLTSAGRKQAASPSSFNVIKKDNIVIIETTNSIDYNEKMEQATDEMPCEGIVSRLKNRFMIDQSSSSNIGYKRSYTAHKNQINVTGESSEERKKLPTHPQSPRKEGGTNTLPTTSEEEEVTSPVPKMNENAKVTARRGSIEHSTLANSKTTNSESRHIEFKPTSVDGSKTFTEMKLHKKVSLEVLPLAQRNKTEMPSYKKMSTKSVSAAKVGGRSSSILDLGNTEIDCSNLSTDKAKQYNELMKQSRTFQIVPKSAAISDHNSQLTSTSAAKSSEVEPFVGYSLNDGASLAAKAVEYETKLPCTDIDAHMDKIVLTNKEKDSETNSRADLTKVVAPKVIPQTKALSEKKTEKNRVESPPSKFRPQVQSANSRFGKGRPAVGGGMTFRIDPKKFKRSAAPPTIQSQPAKPREATVTKVIYETTKEQKEEPKIIKKEGKRKPTVDQIEVIGGYVKLSRSILSSKSTTDTKKRSVSFTLDTKQCKPKDEFRNSNLNNNNNTKKRFYNRTGMYVPSPERNLSELTKTEVNHERESESKKAVETTIELREEKVESTETEEGGLETFENFIPESALNSASDSNSDDEDHLQALPTSLHQAAIYSHTDTNDLLF